MRSSIFAAGFCAVATMAAAETPVLTVLTYDSFATEWGPGPAVADDAPPHPRLALLVEDDPSVRQWLRRELLELGYSVIEAVNGEEALPLIDHTPGIGLLLTDVVMPGAIDGVALARHARRMTDIPQILLMSGFVSGHQVPADLPPLH